MTSKKYKERKWSIQNLYCAKIEVLHSSFKCQVDICGLAPFPFQLFVLTSLPKAAVRLSFGVGIDVGERTSSPPPLMISSYLTFSPASTFLLSKEEVRGREVDMRRGSRSDSAVSIGSLVAFSFSDSEAGIERLSFDAEASEFSRGRTTPAVYASEIFGILGLRALLRKLAPHRVGVLGVCSSLSSPTLLLLVFFDDGMYDVDMVEVGVAKGSEFRKVCALWEAEWKEFFVFVTSEVRFDARREDFRGVKEVLVLEDMRDRFVVDAA